MNLIAPLVVFTPTTLDATQRSQAFFSTGDPSPKFGLPDLRCVVLRV